MEENPYQSTTTPESKSDDDDDDEEGARVGSSRSTSAIASAMLESVENKRETIENKKAQRVVELFKRNKEQPETNVPVETNKTVTTLTAENSDESRPLATDADDAELSSNIESTQAEPILAESSLDRLISVDAANRNELADSGLLAGEDPGTIEITPEVSQSTRQRIETGFLSDYSFEPDANKLPEGNRYRGEVIIEREISLNEPSETEVNLRGTYENRTLNENTKEHDNSDVPADKTLETPPGNDSPDMGSKLIDTQTTVNENIDVEPTKDAQDVPYPEAVQPAIDSRPTRYTPNIDLSRVYNTPNVAPPSMPEVTITPEELEIAKDASHQRGARKGLIAGLLIGGGYEHFKHRRNEKKVAKNHEKQLRAEEKNIRTLSEQQIYSNHTQAPDAAKIEIQPHLTTRVEQSNFEKIAETSQVQTTTAPEQSQSRTVQATHIERTFKNRRFNTIESGRAQERPLATATAMERFRSAQAEKGFTARLNKLLPKREERHPIRENDLKNDQLHVPLEHRIQTSAWHAIEVDAKTGKPVENGTFDYGQEYYRERAHEISEPNDARDTAAGEVALVAAAFASNGQSTQEDGVAQHGQAATQSSHEQSNNQKKSDQNSENKAALVKDKATKALKQSLTNSGPIWPFIVAFGVVVLLLALAFR